MPFKQIDSILGIASRINALVFLDVQVGFSNVEAEIPLLEKYLKMLACASGIDPEFSMKTEKNLVLSLERWMQRISILSPTISRIW